MIRKRQKQLSAVRRATIQQCVGNQNGNPEDIPTAKGYQVFPFVMAPLGQWIGQNQMNEESVRIASVNLKLGDFIAKQWIEQYVEVGKSASYGAKQLCFIS
jgi:hypothetical protein